MTAVKPTDSTNAIGADEEPAKAYFEAAYKAFLRAEEETGELIDRYYTVGQRTVRLRFAGRSLLPRITPALQHLAAESTLEPALTVCLWDSASSDAGTPPPPPWRARDYLPRGEIRGHQSGPISVAYLPMTGALSMMDMARKLALYWVPDANLVPYWETAAPLRSILHWWESGPIRQLAHAAAVGTAAGGVLMAGKGGSGKSTTALACLHAGLLYAGDDYVLIGLEPTPYVYSLYSSAKLDGDQAQRFPHLASAIHNPESLDTEKALLFLHDCHPERVVHGLPVRAILLPTVTGRRDTTLKESSPAAALASLAPTTIFQLPRAGNGAFRMMAHFVQQVPVYSLELGWDIPAIPGLISQFLDRLQARGEAS